MFERRFEFVDKSRRPAVLRDAVEEKSDGEDGGRDGVCRGTGGHGHTTAVGRRRHRDRAANLPATPPPSAVATNQPFPADFLNFRRRPPASRPPTSSMTAIVRQVSREHPAQSPPGPPLRRREGA